LWQLSSDGRDVNHLIAYAYDAVMVYLHAIDFLLKNKLIVLGQIRRQVRSPSCSSNPAMLASSHPTPHFRTARGCRPSWPCIDWSMMIDGAVQVISGKLVKKTMAESINFRGVTENISFSGGRAGSKVHPSPTYFTPWLCFGLAQASFCTPLSTVITT
jgi:hypothetical protein